MSPFKQYIKTIMEDELNIIFDIVKKNKLNKFGFILLNLNSKSKKNIGHYIAIYIDLKNDLWCEIFDPLWKNNLSKKILLLIKSFLEKLNVEWYLKLKINKIQFQSTLSPNCGWFSIKFLLQRFNNIPFKIATSYDKIKKNEKNIEELKKKYNKFGYI